MDKYQKVIHDYENLQHPLAAPLKEQVEFGMRHAEVLPEIEILTLISKSVNNPIITHDILKYSQLVVEAFNQVSPMSIMV